MSGIGLLAPFASRADDLGVEPIVLESEPDASLDEGASYPIDLFEITYRDPHPDHPALDGVLPVRVELSRTPTGWTAPRSDYPAESVGINNTPRPLEDFHPSAIGAIARAVLHEVHDLGLLGVFVAPSEADLDIHNEKDLRADGDTRLRFVVWTGRIKEVRTVAAGERIKDDWIINNEVYEHILWSSPLHPEGEGPDYSTDLLRKDLLEDYLFKINRHPGRYAEAALASSADGEGVALDYRIHENRPWSAYAQASNTGTPRTAEWQTRFGYVHRQVSGRDDIFSLEYLNAGGLNVNAVHGSYVAPWFRKKRPSWLKKSGFEPSWLSWLDRDKIPWWGSDRMQWRVAGSWSRVEIENVTGLDNIQLGSDDLLTEDWDLSGQLIYNLWQQRAFFLDGFAGARHRNVQVHNETLGNRGTAQIWLPEAGLKFERFNEYSALYGFFMWEYGHSNSNASNFESDLGRNNSDSKWHVLRWDMAWSSFIEPIVNRREWEDPSTASSSTLAHEIYLGTRGQYAFDYRLIPQVSQVIGGLYSVRGFDQGLAVGDSVYLGTLEYRFHIPRALPVQRQPLRLPWVGEFRAAPQQVYGRPDWDLILRGFVDAGQTIRNDRPTSVFSEANQTLVGAGVGIEFDYRGMLRARVDWGRGLYWDVDESCGSCANINNSIDKNGVWNFLITIVY